MTSKMSYRARCSARDRLKKVDKSKHCHYCYIEFKTTGTGSKRTMDHKIPWCKFDRPAMANKIENLLWACSSCNQHKGDTSYEDFLESKWLIRKRSIVARNTRAAIRKASRVSWVISTGQIPIVAAKSLPIWSLSSIQLAVSIVLAGSRLRVSAVAH